MRAFAIAKVYGNRRNLALSAGRRAEFAQACDDSVKGGERIEHHHRVLHHLARFEHPAIPICHFAELNAAEVLAAEFA